MFNVFVYGTLKRGQGNNRLLVQGNATFIAEAHTARHFVMYDGGFPRVAEIGELPRGTSSSQHGGHITGELWSCDAACRERLDRLEGHPNHYRREEVMVLVRGNIVGFPATCPVMAGMYIINHPGMRFGNAMKPVGGALTWASSFRSFGG